MTLNRKLLLASAALLTSAGAAQAQPVDGFYVGAGAGLNLVPGAKASIDSTAGQRFPAATVNLGTGTIAAASIGYGFGNGLRMDVEASLRSNDHSGGGSQTLLSAMSNVLFDFDIGLPWMYPYIGIGGGYQQAQWRNLTLSAGGTGIAANQTVGDLAYQAIIGAAFPIASVPGLSLTAEYRFMDKAGSRSFASHVLTGAASGAATHAHPSDMASHSVLLGLRYVFDQPEEAGAPLADTRPPLAAPPVPTPELPRTYLIFFDWKHADLSPRARDVVAEAARNASKVSHTRIDLTGHADASGSSRANQALSLKRAQAVAAELTKWGIKPEEIDIHAVGDGKPLIDNKPGTREPQNRVVEIVYR